MFQRSFKSPAFGKPENAEFNNVYLETNSIQTNSKVLERYFKSS